MSKLEEIIQMYKDENAELGLGIDNDLLEKVTRNLGPSIYDADASTVSGTDEDELQTVKTNYLMGKLGLSDSPELDEAIQEAVQKLGTSNRNKYRALMYAMLCEKFGKQSVYN